MKSKMIDKLRYPFDEPSDARFDTTHWSVVLAAGHRSSPDADEALQTLAQTYWFPLYAYLRRRGFHSHDASDLTQEFFARLIEKNYVADATRDRGRFRSFLLTALKHFLANERRKRTAQKRGRRQMPLRLDLTKGESRYSVETAHSDPPDQLFERQWAITVMEQVLTRLREEYSQRGQQEYFDRLKPLLAKKHETGASAEAAAALGMTANSVQVAVHRLRRRYQELLRLVVAQTVSAPDEVDDEILSLFRAVES